MKPEDMQALAKALAPVLRDAITAHINTLRKDLQTEIASALAEFKIPELPPLEIPEIDTAALVQEILAAIPAPKDGADGAAGKDVDPAAIEVSCTAIITRLFEGARTQLAATIDKAIADIPVPKDGRDGVDGKDGARGIDGAPGKDGAAGKDADVEALIDLCKNSIAVLFDAARLEFDEALTKAIAGVPVPKDGAPGRDGAHGEDGAPGKDGYVGKDGAAGQNGNDGRDGVNGIDGAPGKDGYVGKDGAAGQNGNDGRDGVNGKDGIAPTADDVAAVFERRFSDLLLAWERRFGEAIEKAVDRIPVPKDGKDGAAGKDGRDAFPLEAFDVQLDADGRTLLLTFTAGELTQQKHLRLPIVKDQGVWREGGPETGGTYVQGDGVTKDGSFWIAQQDDPQGAPGTSAAWRMAVKKGRDGRDLRPSASTHDPGKGVPLK